ncbi:MAG TPA: mammalian cell entry protein, partial [Planctomycetota bacterium]|nr:mammalian cell entry protein [Planctomycetota bacterium]
EQASVSVQTALAQATLTMQRLQALADEGGALSGPLRDALAELARSLRSVRELVDMLERHPEALIRGKPDGDR